MAEASTAETSKHLKHQLLQRVAPLNRGALASPIDKENVNALIKKLEDTWQASSETNMAGKLSGKWLLVYTSVEAFRSSPFFWAFQEGLVQNRSLASEIFKFTDGVPGAEVGLAYQTISMDYSSLVSEVELEVFYSPFGPGLKGNVVTTCAVTLQEPDELKVSCMPSVMSKWT